jgi:SPP1 gp7 family putative phage head morphogenesis protein
MANIRNRLAGAKRQVLALIDTIPVLKQNHIDVNRSAYTWEMSPERISQVDALIFEIVNQWFDTSSDKMPSRWFFTQYTETAAQKGAADAVNNIVNVSRGIVSVADLDMMSVQRIFQEPQYKRAITSLYGRAFNEMDGFAGETAADLARVLADNMFLGKSARAAKKAIADRFKVADHRAERIARTEINRAYTNARTETATIEAERLGIDIRVLHRSSLMPTTRREHAKRHGNVYTIQEQNDWWAEDANRINCLCSIGEVVVGKDGKIRSYGAQERMEKQRETWLKTSGVRK